MSDQFCIECFTYGAIKGGMVLVEGPPAVGKSSLVKAFVRLALQNDQPVVYVSSQSSANDVKDEIGKAAGIDLTPQRMQILDCYSSTAAISSQDVKTFSPGNLSEISIEVQSKISGLDRPYLVFDSIDPFALDASEDAALKFFRNTTARVKAKATTGSATLTTGVHSERFQTALRTVFQGIIELKLEETSDGLERFLRIFALKGAAHTTNWYPFTITEDGIVIGTEEYREGLPPRHKEPHFLRFVS